MLPVISDASVGHAGADAAVGAHQREHLAAHIAQREPFHGAVVDEYRRFCHHYKVQNR